MNTGAFFFAGSFGRAAAFRIGVGVDSCVLERIEEEIRPIEKPCTMLCELRSVDVLTSEPTGGLILDPSLPIAVATVDVEESGAI